MTYNIRLGIQQGVAAIAQTISDCGGADIIALQEVGKHWSMGPAGDTVAELADRLAMAHALFVPTITDADAPGPPAQYGHGLLSRWPIAEKQVHRLPQLQDEPRALLKVRIDTDHRPVILITTHLSHITPDRPVQGKFLADALDGHREKGPRFLMGDLNAEDDEPWLHGLLGHWEDADADMRRLTFPAEAPTRRIDYILAQRAKLIHSDVPPATKSSDHRPVVALWDISGDSP